MTGVKRPPANVIANRERPLWSPSRTAGARARRTAPTRYRRLRILDCALGTRSADRVVVQRQVPIELNVVDKVDKWLVHRRREAGLAPSQRPGHQSATRDHGYVSFRIRRKP